MAKPPHYSDPTAAIQHLHGDRDDLAATLRELDGMVTAQLRADSEKVSRISEQWYARIARLFDLETEHLMAIAEQAEADPDDRQSWAELRAYLEAAAAETITRDLDAWSPAFREVHARTFCDALQRRLNDADFDGDQATAVHHAWRVACWTALWYEDHAT